MTTTTYSTRTDAIDAIIDAIEAHPAITWARAEYDIDAIADEVIGDYADGYRIADGIEFWASVSRHARHARPTAQEIADQLNAYQGETSGRTSSVASTSTRTRSRPPTPTVRATSSSCATAL